MNIIRFSLLTFLLFIFLNACVEDPTTSEDTLEVAQDVKDQAAIGWQLNKTVLTGSEIQGLTQNSNYLDDESIDEFSSMSALSGEAIRLNTDLKKELPQRLTSFYKSNGDSLVFFEDNAILGIRTALYYNPETDIARYYQVKYKFAAWRNIEYDSSQVTATLNNTPENNGDDHLKSLYRYQSFKQNYFVQKIVSNLEITDYDDTEVTGAKATSDAYYHDDRLLQHKKQYVEIKPDKSGTLREEFDFKNGKNAYNMVTFKDDGTGTFEKKLRTGLLISGTFDSAEDDLQGSYSETIDFPSGIIDKIIKKANVSITLPDSVFNADFSEAVYFTSGRVDSESVALQISDNNGLKTSVFNIRKSNGAHGMLTIVEGNEDATLEGKWTTWNGYYIIVNAEYYFDESAHLHYEVFQSETAFNAGENPLIVADYYFSPDQTGTGTISHNGEKYDVTFDETGNGELSQGDKKASINLY